MYGVKYQIHFVAINNDAYRIEILIDQYDGDVYNLVGAENPITTEENNSDDIFMPIRTQTGALRIADNGYDADGNEFEYTELLPVDTFDYQVRLWKESNTGEEDTLRWIGYIKPETLTSRMYEKVSIREYRLVCPLGCLYELPMTFSNNKSNFGTIKSIGQILYMALSSVNVDWENVYQQHNVVGCGDLTAKISLLNFVKNNKPTISGQTDVDTFTATWKDESTSFGNVVEEICKFFGWTLYSRGLDIIIRVHDTPERFIKFAFSELATGEVVESSTASDIVQYLSNPEYIESQLQFASTNHSESRMIGYREINVESNVNKNSDVVNIDFERIPFKFFYLNGAVYQDFDTPRIRRSGDKNFVTRRIHIESGANTVLFVDNIQLFENRNIAGHTVECVLEQNQSWTQDEFPFAENYSLESGLATYYTQTNITPVVMFFAKTAEDIIFHDTSAICIDATAIPNYVPTDSIPGQLKGHLIYFALGIGDMWYDGSGWVQQNTPIIVQSRCIYTYDNGSIISPVNSISTGNQLAGILADSHNGSSGYLILPFTSYPSVLGNIKGRLKFIVYSTNILATIPDIFSMNCVLNDLKINIYNSDSKLNPKAKESHQFTGVANLRFKNNLSVQLSMASGINNLYGKGQLYMNNLSLLSTLQYTNGFMQPEERLKDMYIERYKNVITKRIVEVMDSEDASNPRAIIYNDENELIFSRPLCCSHNWREGTMKLTLIEKP